MMKRVILILLVCWQVAASAQDGVQFRDLSFREALEQAKTENKWVFVDCYTSWCGPCRYMTEKVFSQKAAGDYFNSRFVCVKFDMEKGEGKELSERLGVRAYPSFYILSPNGSIRHKVVGAGELDEFIGKVDKGVHEKTSLYYWQQRYEAGNLKSKSDLMDSYCVMAEAAEDEKAADLYQRLWSQLTEKERMKPAYWPLYKDDNCKLDSPQWDFLLTHLEDMRQHIGREEVDRYLSARYGRILQNMIEGYRIREKISFEELSRQIQWVNLEQLSKMLPLADLVANQKTEELAAFIEQELSHCSIDTLSIYASAFQGISWLNYGQVTENWERCGDRLAALVLQRMDREVTTLTASDFLNCLNALFCFQRTLKPELCRQVIALGDKVLSQFPEDKDSAAIKQHMEQLRGKVENP